MLKKKLKIKNYENNIFKLKNDLTIVKKNLKIKEERIKKLESEISIIKKEIINKENIIYALNVDKNNLNKQLNILKNEFKKEKDDIIAKERNNAKKNEDLIMKLFTEKIKEMENQLDKNIGEFKENILNYIDF